MDHTLDFIAGCVAGSAGVIVGHPFDTVKVRLVLNPRYRGTFHCFHSTIRNEGVRGLYKGITSPLYSLAFINAVVFGVQSNIMRHWDNSLSSHFLAGSIAGLSQSWICSPMELAKIRMQATETMSSGKQQRAVEYLKKIHQLEGIRGVYRGMNATIVREIPAFGTYFVTYEYLCRQFTPQGAQFCPAYGLLVAGGVAGCSSWLSNYPIDVIKTRIQRDGELKGGRFHYKYNGYMDCIRQSIAEDGYRVFFRGLNATLLRAFITNAVTFPVYTMCIRYMRPNETEEEFRESLERSTMVAQRE